MLPKKQKIHLDNEFNEIFKTGRSLYGRFLGVRCQKNAREINRFAIILGVKVEKSSVKRHFLKRNLFRLIKNNESHLLFFVDCIIVALPSIKNANQNELEMEIKKLFSKISLVR
ncbi:MAG: ribonuclease P protein component [Clostridia bacterium]|nr:ribonuclease P protein component [Clostridia bacterium]